MRSILVAFLLVWSLNAQTNAQRPHVLGLAHVAVRVSDMGKTGRVPHVSRFSRRGMSALEHLENKVRHFVTHVLDVSAAQR